MSIYAISDLHLCLSNPDKTMEAFGPEWNNYIEKIKTNWTKTVMPTDTVIIAGDISWGLSLDECIDDFKFLDSLPGQKIILKGNHDYYFTTVKKTMDFFKANDINSIKILYNNSFYVEGYNICGTRFWGTVEKDDSNPEKIFNRELIRLKMSLDSIEKVDAPIIVATHFPPFKNGVKKILEQYNVKKCVYGHLHGAGHNLIRTGLIDGIEYIMVGCDYTDFELIKLN